MPIGPWFMGIDHWGEAPGYYDVAPRRDGSWFWCVFPFDPSRGPQNPADEMRSGSSASEVEARYAALESLPGAHEFPVGQVRPARWFESRRP